MQPHTPETHTPISESASMATHTLSRGRVKKEKLVGLGRKGEATIEHFLCFEAEMTTKYFTNVPQST